MTYGYGDKPEDVARRIDGYLPTDRRRAVAVSIDGGPLVFGLLRIDFDVFEDHFAITGNVNIRRGRYDWSVEVEASPVPGMVDLAMGDINTQPLTGIASQRSWTAEANERMWTAYTAASELGGYAESRTAP